MSADGTRGAGTARALVLHAYSAGNQGDGLLLAEAAALAREVLGGGAEVVVAASDPASFAGLGLRVVDSRPSWHGWDPGYRRVLAGIGEFDLVLGVGGGYLRFGTVREALVSALVQVPQLRAAARRGRGVVYLPQSVGPCRFGWRRPVAGWLGRVDRVFARDGRTQAELAGVGARRCPDMGLLAPGWRDSRPGPLAQVPVLSVRALRGAVPAPVRQLAAELGECDGFVQSAVRRNDDRAAAESMLPRHLLSRDELTGDGPASVVVAMRLHAAVAALGAGHFAVHLAYERKGFGAFEDLGLEDWVFPARRFDVDRVVERVRGLLADDAVRAAYTSKVAQARARFAKARAELVEEVRECVRTG
ncbi:MAG: polysaccharide pyruvyl transferase family protein [Bifidobacteriaceae bacterium]|jgi:polysaccharide pyruvyl transferase WcaK-like protein|nr:polysaccharide pyruvyl transferase family protein [Bifidobacteriaceae bacterium]